MLYIYVYDIWIHKQQYMAHRTPENGVYALKYVCSVVGKTMIDQWNGVPHVRANPYCTGYCMSCVFNGFKFNWGVWQCVVQCHAIPNFGLWMVLGYYWVYWYTVYHIPLFEMMQN